MNNVVSTRPEDLIDAVTTCHVVVAFETVEVVISSSTEEVVDPGCAEDPLIVIVADPLETSDVCKALVLIVFWTVEDFNGCAGVVVCKQISVLLNRERDSRYCAGLTCRLRSP